MFELNDKVAIVTGGCRGLGKAIAAGLAEHGANVVIADILKEEAEEAAKEIKTDYQVETLALKTDVSDEDSVKSMVDETIDKWGKIDILVNNAGIYRTCPAEKCEPQDFDKTIDVNLKGQFLCAREVGRHMIERGEGGKVINIASVAGELAFGDSVAYNCSKGGVVMLTESLATDWAEHEINVNAIAPGLFATPMTEELMKSEAIQDMINSDIPLARPGEPEELKGIAIYLASSASDYMTGEVVEVDGGWTSAL